MITLGPGPWIPAKFKYVMSNQLPGYNLSGSSLGHLFCQQKGWTGVQPYCDVDPDVPPPPKPSHTSHATSKHHSKSSPVMCTSDHGCDHECHLVRKLFDIDKKKILVSFLTRKLIASINDVTHIWFILTPPPPL